MQFVNTLVLLAAINTAAALPSYSLPQRHWLSTEEPLVQPVQYLLDWYPNWLRCTMHPLLKPWRCFVTSCQASTEVVGTVAPALIELLEDKETPDMACHAIGLCKNETGQFCHIFPLPNHSSDEDISRVTSARKKMASFLSATPNLRMQLYNAISIGICDIFKTHIFKKSCTFGRL